MPFTIVQGDITKQWVDAIVNAANVHLLHGSGVCGAIFDAAGPRELQAACDRLAPIETGEAVITPGFALPAAHVVHTAGPVYRGGGHGEEGLLRACYRNSLDAAFAEGCRSIAFPLISSGIFGYPKDEALSVATDAITGWLFSEEKADMDVVLVVFDKGAFSPPAGLADAVREFISENFADGGRDEDMACEAGPALDESYASRSRKLRERIEDMRRTDEMRRIDEMRMNDEMRMKEEARTAAAKKPPAAAPEPSLAPESSLAPERAFKFKTVPASRPDTESEPESNPVISNAFSVLRSGADAIPGAYDDGVDAYPVIFEDSEVACQLVLEESAALGSAAPLSIQLDEPFSATLFRFIDTKGKTDVEVYKRANLDRKLFSKIRKGDGYMPSKKTAVALAVALELTLDETNDLLERAGFALSRSLVFDVIVEYFITNRKYNIFEINNMLFEYDQPLLGG